MTENIHLEKVLAIDPKTNVEETFRPKEVIAKGGVQKSRYAFNADSYSATSMAWNNINPSSLNTVVERCLRVKYTIQVSVVYATAAAANAVFFPALLNGVVYRPAGAGAVVSPLGVLRNFPLQQCCSGLELKINGNSTSVISSEFINMYSLLLSDDEHRTYCCEFPTQADSSAIYVAPGTDLRSPFNLYQANTSVPSRGSFVGTLVSSTAAGPNTTDTYTFDVVEQLIISPMTFGDGIDSGIGLSNINYISVNINLDNVSRAISVVPTAGNTVTVNFASTSPQLLMEFITQDPILAARQPEQLIYNYEVVRPENKTGVVQNNTMTADQTFNSNSLRLSSIPDKLYLFIKPSKNSLAANPVLAQQYPGTFLRIKNVSLNFGNRQALFNNYTEQDLYKMSVKNGLKADFHAWKYKGACVVIIDTTRDIALEPDQVVGQASVFITMDVQVRYDASPIVYAANAVDCAFDLCVLTSLNGKCIITKNDCQYLLTAPSGEEVLAISSNPHAKVDANAVDALSKADGKGLFSSAAKLLSRGLDLAKNVKPEHIEMAKKAVDSLGGALVGGKLHKKRTY